MTTFTDSHRTDLSDYDYCGDDHLYEICPEINIQHQKESWLGIYLYLWDETMTVEDLLLAI